MSGKLKVLFLCTGNSCRSQMAEGWARYLKGDIIEAYSAGIETHGLNPNAVKVMAEAGVDISGYRSKNIQEFSNAGLDVIITVCDQARETCPFLAGNFRMIHTGFSDPPQMAREIAEHGATEEEQLDCYRKVRDEIKAFIEKLPDSL